jgi:hypothetical protein
MIRYPTKRERYVRELPEAEMASSESETPESSLPGIFSDKGLSSFMAL